MDDRMEGLQSSRTILKSTEKDTYSSPDEAPLNIEGDSDDQNGSFSTQHRLGTSAIPQLMSNMGTSRHNGPQIGLPPHGVPGEQRVGRRLPEASDGTLRKPISVLVPSPKFSPLPHASGRTGLVYDVRMRFHIDQISAQDDAHPEKPQRIQQIYSELVDSGLVHDPQSTVPASDLQAVRIDARMATVAEIAMVHSDALIEKVKNTATLSLDEIMERSRYSDTDSIYWHNQTWFCASLSVGGAIEATRAVVAGQIKNAVAVIRPPGHHAEHDKESGFCFFNNVPIAVKVAQEDFPDLCRKVLILDWDVHHGNGTQKAFYDDPNVLYISIHVHQDGNFYPYGPDGDHVHCGDGPGLGRNVNIPWSNAGMTDSDYIMAFQQVVMPIAIEFDPDLVMISAGFDAAMDDPLGNCFVTPAGFAHMTHMLKSLAKGKVVACLEGGYNLRATAKSFTAMTRTLLGEPPERLLPHEAGAEMRASPSAVNTIHAVIRTQSRFWKCMYPKTPDVRRRRQLQSKRAHDLIRYAQSRELLDEMGMVELWIMRNVVSRSFENQVLATPSFNEARPLLVVFHDPPEITGYPDTQTSKLELHNTWITDVNKKYVEWAVKNHFAVIDVNIPQYFSSPDDSREFIDEHSSRKEHMRQLANYLWANYIQVGDSTQIVLMGIGDACSGIVDLLKEGISVVSRIDLAIAFVGNYDLRGVEDPDDDRVAKTYFRKSMVFISDSHAAFTKNTKRLKRRHGTIYQSPETEIQDLLDRHFNEVTEALSKLTEGYREQNGLKRQEVKPPGLEELGFDRGMNLDGQDDRSRDEMEEKPSSGFATQMGTKNWDSGSAFETQEMQFSSGEIGR